jgi:hypothetical protein
MFLGFGVFSANLTKIGVLLHILPLFQSQKTEKNPYSWFDWNSS